MAWQMLSNHLLITTSDAGVSIQTLSLGEYCTPVSRLSIYDDQSGDQVVWLIAKNEDSRMHTVSVHTGVSAFDDRYLEGYSVSFRTDSPYAFRSGVRYRVVVRWGHFSSERTFVFPDSSNNKRCIAAKPASTPFVEQARR
jgi:hypothetical protein